MAGETVKVKGYKEFLRACDRAGKETKKEIRSTFRRVGDIVKVDAASRFAPIDAKTAKGFRTVVRQRGVAVEQRLGKSPVLSRRRPKFGGLQMRHALEPALESEAHAVERAMEEAMDTVADHFSR